MRLDKYIKLTRLIKRRGVAKVLINEGSVLVNNKISKPSYEVKINDIVLLKLGRRHITIKINSITDNVGKENCDSLYEILKDELSTI